jgi:hypothetical protein
VEYSLARAPIDPDDRACLLRRARRMAFDRRTWETLLDRADDRARLWPRIRPFARSLKLMDMATLLARLEWPMPPPPPTVPPRLVETRRYRRMLSAAMPAA